MAEVFGIVSGAVGIAAVFTACIDCFDLIQAGRHLGRDFTTENLKLECARYRLCSWGEASNIYATSPFATICDNETAKVLAEKILSQILDLFQRSQKISERYSQADLSNESETATIAENPQNRTASGITTKLKSIAQRRRRGPGLVRRATWAVYHQEEFKQLIDGLTNFLDKLDELIAVSQRRLELALHDAEELSQTTSIEDLKKLGCAARGVDGQLDAAIMSSVNAGHKYSNISAYEDAKMLNGDAVSDGWTGHQLGSSHSYDGVSAHGRSRIINGNKYGGKDILAD